MVKIDGVLKMCNEFLLRASSVPQPSIDFSLCPLLPPVAVANVFNPLKPGCPF
jgi:hypothetical protein